MLFGSGSRLIWKCSLDVKSLGHISITGLITNGSKSPLCSMLFNIKNYWSNSPEKVANHPMKTASGGHSISKFGWPMTIGLFFFGSEHSLVSRTKMRARRTRDTASEWIINWFRKNVAPLARHLSLRRTRQIVSNIFLFWYFFGWINGFAAAN